MKGLEKGKKLPQLRAASQSVSVSQFLICTTGMLILTYPPDMGIMRINLFMLGKGLIIAISFSMEWSCQVGAESHWWGSVRKLACLLAVQYVHLWVHIRLETLV